MATLAIHGPKVVAATEAIADDLAHGRVIGKELGDRHVSGNLTGFARVKFDVPGQRPQRFRLIYRGAIRLPAGASITARTLRKASITSSP